MLDEAILSDFGFTERLITERIFPKAKILLIKLRSIGDVVYICLYVIAGF